VAVLNADDPRVRAQAARTRARISLFGLGRDADFRAEAVRPEGVGHRFRLVTPDAHADVFVPGLGEFTVANALAAAAAARAAGVGLEHVVAGLARHRPAPGRLERVALPGGAVLLDDTYNANPQSLEAALRALAGRKGAARGLVVLGDMGELGEAAPEAHRAAGRRVAELGFDELLVLGERAGDVAEGATRAGLDATRIHVARDHEEAARELRKRLRPGDWVLVKGSRAARMERVVTALTREGD
jgi:UDP-N-acetylmuramoyl-tripeptide--D-alanyl-D-alanine ligase